MKKFLKFVAGVAAVAGAACGVVYCLKKFCGIDLLNRDEDFDEFDEEFDDDFDDDFDDASDDDEKSDEENGTSDDDESGDRPCVTLDMDGVVAWEKDDSEEEKAEVLVVR